MSSQASSPTASLNPSQESNVAESSSSPNSKNDSSILSQESSQLDPDSSALSAETERHPKGKRKRTAYVPSMPLPLPITDSKDFRGLLD